MPAPEIFVVVCQAAFFVAAAWLSHIDIREHRLPNRGTAPLALATLAVLVAAALLEQSADPLVRGAAGGVVLGGFYVALRAASRGGLGGGDVKLAVPVGMLLAWDGWLALVAGGALAFFVGSAVAVGAIVARSGSLETRIPFGPCIVLGACLGLVCT